MNLSENTSKLAHKYFKSGGYDVAVNLLLPYLRENEGDIDARLLLVRAAERLGLMEIAMEQAKVAKQLASLGNKPNPEIDEALARLNMAQGAAGDGAPGAPPPQQPEGTPKPANINFAAAGGGDRFLAAEPAGERQTGNSLGRLVSPYFGFPEATNKENENPWDKELAS